MEASVTRKPKLRSACDRCYELKERCERVSTFVHCARCNRLGLVCSTARPVRPVGRRAQRPTGSATMTALRKLITPQQNQQGVDASSNRVLTHLLEEEEEELLMSLLIQPEDFDQYIMWPSFQTVQQQVPPIQLPAALPALKDALLACAITLKQLRAGTSMNIDTAPSVHYISKAMDTLRSLPVSSPEDVILCHTLGGLLAFSISSAIGVGVPEICRHCLGTTSSFYGTNAYETREDRWKTFLILLETMNCLVYRQKPTLRISAPPPPITVDCRLGLCVPLLPYYYDLCVISNSLLTAENPSTLTVLQKQLDDIRDIVEPWQPSHLGQLVDQFDSVQILHLLAQAKVYRLGALLVGHRLRFPFGQEDAQAEIWSKEIMLELEMAERVTKRSLRFVTLPFIVAAIEAQDEILRFRTLQRVDDCVDHYAPPIQEATKTFLSRVWHERDLNLTTRWFESLHKPCRILESIQSTCFSA